MIDERDGVSYPGAVESPEDATYLIYDYHRTSDKQILMAVFTEADVLAGRWVSSVARQRVVVNQATGTPPPRPARAVRRRRELPRPTRSPALPCRRTVVALRNRERRLKASESRGLKQD